MLRFALKPLAASLSENGQPVINKLPVVPIDDWPCEDPRSHILFFTHDINKSGIRSTLDMLKSSNYLQVKKLPHGDE